MVTGTAWEVAAATPDPELPMLTVADLGILREVAEEADRVTATITPTYSGCPALREITADLRHRLVAAGYPVVEIRTRLAPPWTSDWITAEGRRKLAEAGLAPPRGDRTPRGAGAAYLDDPAARGLSALRLAPDGAHRRVQRYGLQGALPVRGLPGAVRVRQGARVSAATEFHRLSIDRVDELTSDAAAVTFAVPDSLRDRFAFAPGQSVTVRRKVDGREERRSYSICAPAGRPPRIGVREVAGGLVSGWLVHQVRAGDVVEVQAPSGSFTPDLGVGGEHVLIAAGSGITPVLSIASSLLESRDDTRVTLLYGNRRSDTVMFADELAELKDVYTDRVRLMHVLSREPQEVELFTGRLDAAKLRELLPVTVTVGSVDHWWICGPFEMTSGAIEVLGELGVPRARVHRELFYVEDVPPAEVHHEDAPAGAGAEATVILDGRASAVTVPPGTAVLDAAQRVRPDLPFACKGGVCGTCRALLRDGEVRMRRNYALEPEELAAGYVLTCQSLPVSETLTVDYDA